jgi:hypothetical protein
MRRTPAAACRALERGACCKKEEHNLHSFARTATKKIATWGRNIRPNHLICKVLLTNIGAKCKARFPRMPEAKNQLEIK